MPLAAFLDEHGIKQSDTDPGFLDVVRRVLVKMSCTGRSGVSLCSLHGTGCDRSMVQDHDSLEHVQDMLEMARQKLAGASFTRIVPASLGTPNATTPSQVGVCAASSRFKVCGNGFA